MNSCAPWASNLAHESSSISPLEPILALAVSVGPPAWPSCHTLIPNLANKKNSHCHWEKTNAFTQTTSNNSWKKWEWERVCIPTFCSVQELHVLHRSTHCTISFSRLCHVLVCCQKHWNWNWLYDSRSNFGMWCLIPPRFGSPTPADASCWRVSLTQPKRVMGRTELQRAQGVPGSWEVANLEVQTYSLYSSIGQSGK